MVKCPYHHYIKAISIRIYLSQHILACLCSGIYIAWTNCIIFNNRTFTLFDMSVFFTRTYKKYSWLFIKLSYSIKKINTAFYININCKRWILPRICN